MTWIRLATHWVVSDCDHWEGQHLHTKQGLCRVTYARGWMRMCVEFRDEILLRGGGGGGRM